MIGEPDVVVELLKQFGIDPHSRGGSLFVEFVMRCAIFRHSHPLDKTGSGAVLRLMAHEHNMFYRGLEAIIKSAIKPLMVASPDRLWKYGLSPEKRTVCGFAWDVCGLLQWWD